jgi:hypothetical protein
MNRMHRVVWSESRNAFIVAGEHAQARETTFDCSEPALLEVPLLGTLQL